ncbi:MULTISPECIES: thiamine pyrophosphate-dependent enzyme [unclassified Pedobacter]|uniref:alpha-ketoacid dehydrogenase subunit alpha/beta n=1 Tax=unclassified Pedobacter TaxID=2628915 RepID=UPI0014246E81|nr:MULTISPECIES: alpha-ketoacid dehydrogenase subunit alpha/beta [unclassified Pedobacter]NII85886.1 2-oxoisovalerate dehydrogenase E1 component [Pedobacter sp. SG908]NMN39199.1 2-oxoisovalerate dehydrogenase E1 component [Pedobacter sp. SG918]
MQFNRGDKDNEFLLNLYRRLLYPRMVEEKMLKLLRQGRIGKWFSGIGQEAIAVGSTLAMQSDEYILPMHRNLGVFTSRDIPLKKLMAQWQGKITGFTKGRDRSFHFGTQEYKIIGMISHLGPQMALADGIALADVLRNQPHATLVYTGEGATSEGDFHEAVNVAAVWNLPVIFLIENNGYGLSTPKSEQFRCKNLVDKAIGYGVEGIQIDGNNILEVYNTINQLAMEIRKDPRPVLVECLTFRMRGHEEASGTKYVPQELFDEWGKKDPLSNYETYLIEQGVLTSDSIIDIKIQVKRDIELEVEEAFNEDEPIANANQEEVDMYFPYTQQVIQPNPSSIEKRYLDAITDGLDLAMQKYPNLVLMGQDIADYGGAFKITDGFTTKYGKDRVRNTPICESAIVGAGLGLSINGYKAVVEMQFADFVTVGFNQIVNNLAKTHYRWGEKADVVVRMPTGAGTSAGPFHSQSNEAWFTKTPGLKIVYPAFPEDAKGLLLAAIEDPNPVLYFEHKYLYRSLIAPVPDGYYTTEIGKAVQLAEGNKFAIITYGLGVHWALDYLKQYPESGATLIDLRTLQPWDKEAVRAAVKATGRVLILHEDTLTNGFGAELSAWIGEHCFSYLDAPVMRCASLDTAIPMSKVLEEDFLAKARLAETINKLLKY